MNRSLGLCLTVICSTPLVCPAITSVNLNTYQRVGRYALPVSTTVTAPSGSLLAKEASAVTYDKDTDSLFVVGDGGTSIVQVSKTGQLINSMTLGPDLSKPQDTYFYDTEGLTYIGNGKFVMIEETYRQANLVTYAAGTTLATAPANTVVKLGTTISNNGIEGITYDPFTSGYVAVKESSLEGIFQTSINFAAGTASNGSASTVNSTNLFAPALLGLSDFADVFSLSNISSLVGQADESHLLVLSQESGKIVETDRAGNVLSTLTITRGAGDIPIADMQHEGLTMDLAGNLYIVSENGGGDSNHPQLWVYTPTPEPASVFAIGGFAVSCLLRRRRR